MATEQPRGIEAAIDRAAREMTATPPTDALRARVRHRVDARRWPGVVFAWRPLTAAVAVVIVAATLVSTMWSGRVPSDEPARVAVDRTAVAPGRQAAEVERSVQPPRVTVAVRGRSAPRAASAAPPVVARAVPPSTIDVEPVVIAPIATEALVVEDGPQPKDIEIEAIGIAPLALASEQESQVE
jgi:hypothetical protein